LVLVVAATCVRLGFWQLSRLEQRQVRNEAIARRSQQAPLETDQLVGDTALLFYRLARVTGSFDNAHTFVLANRTLRGVPGVHVFTPFRLHGRSAYLLVNRGWFPAADGTTVRFDSLQTFTDSVTGMLLPFPAARRPERDTGSAFRRTWFNFDTPSITGQLPYDVLPYQLQLTPVPGDKRFPIRLQPPAPDRGPHLGYAIQWFSFAIIGISGWLALVLRRGQKRKRED
jgi:surfeit locus 1 family protein